MRRQLWHGLKSVVSVLLSISMVMTSMTVPAYAAPDNAAEDNAAEEAVTEAPVENEATDISGLDLENELKNVVDPEEYPDGVISIGETMLNVKEGNETTIRIVRGGNTDKEARVTFKAIDVSAKYGKDYTLEVKGGDVLPANPDSELLMNEDSYVDDGETTEEQENLEFLGKALRMSEKADETEAAAETTDTEAVTHETADEQTVADDAAADEVTEEAVSEAEEVEEAAVGAAEEREAAQSEETAPAEDEDEAAAEDAEFEAVNDEVTEDVSAASDEAEIEEVADETAEEVSAAESEQQDETMQEDVTGDTQESKPLRNRKSSLANAYALQTGKELQDYDWREYDENTIDPEIAEAMAEGEDQAVDQLKEVPGVETQITFKEGEYLKEITVKTIKDGVSESDEQAAIVLYDAEGADLGANYNGYINITDKDVREEIVYEVKDSEITVGASEDKAVITVVRTGGTEQMGFVTVGTSAAQAKAGEDYKSVVKELFFAPSVTEQKIEVPITGSRTTYKDFYVGIKAEGEGCRVNKDKESTHVTISPVIPAAVYRAAESAEGISVIPDGEGGVFVTESGDLGSEEAVEGAGKDVSCYLYNDQNHTYSADTWHYVANVHDIENADYVAVRVDAWGETSYGFFGHPKGKDIDTILCRDLSWHANNQTSAHFFTNDYEWDNWMVMNNNGFGKTENAVVWVKIYATGTNHNCNNHFKIKGCVKHYRDYTFYINNNTSYSKYKEKKYNSTSGYKEQPEMKLGEAKFNMGSGELKDIKTVTLDTYISPEVSYSGKMNTAGVASTSSTVRLKGYYLRKGDKYSELLPTGFRMDASFLSRYIGQYLQSGQGYDFELVPVFEPRKTSVTFKNGESTKGGFRGFKPGDSINLTKLDTVEVNAYQNSGYSIKNIELVSGKNRTDNSKSEKITYFLAGFGNSGDYNTIRINYDVTALKVMADPLGYTENLKQGKVVYIDENEKVYVSDYKNPLKITGVQRYKSYNLTAVTDLNSGYKPVWRDATLDNDEDGKWTADKKVYSGFDVARGNVLSYPMQLAVGRIYYNFEKRAKAAKAGSIEGVLKLIDRPIMYQDDTKLTEERGLNSAQVTCDGVTDYTHYGTKGNGQPTNGLFKLESDNFSIYDQYLVNAVYDGPEGIINTGAPFYPNISRELVVDATQELNFSNVKIYQEEVKNKTLTQEGTKEWVELDTSTHDPDGNYLGLSCATPQTKQEGHADNDKKYLISMDVTKDGYKITGGELNFYDRNGKRDGTTIKAKAKSNGVGFNFEFKPNDCNIEPGYTVRVKFTDNTGHTYLERRLGVMFTQEVGMISISNEFLGGNGGVIDYVGNIASAIDLGWSGKFDTKGSVTINEKGEKVISCGFKIDDAFKKASSSDSDLMQKAKKYVQQQEEVGKAAKARKAAEDALSKAGGGDTTKLQKAVDDAREAESKAERKRDVAKDEFDEEAEKVGNGDKDKKNYKVGYKLSLSISFKLTIVYGLDKDKDSEKYGCYYFKSMTICAILEGTASADVKFTLPFGFTINIGIKLEGTGTFAFIIQEREDGEDNPDIRKKYRHYVASGDQTMAIWDVSGDDRANDAMGAITLKPSIEISVGVGMLADLLEASVSGKAAFDMNFYINSNQSNDGTVTLSAKVAVTALKIFKYEKTIASKKFQLFGSSVADAAEKSQKKQAEINGSMTGFENAMESLEAQNWLDNSADGFITADTAYMAGGTNWNVGARAQRRIKNAEAAIEEAALDGSLDDDESGAYVETEIADKLAESPDFDMADLGNGKYIAVFTNVPAERVGDDSNATAAYYMIYDNGWKQPRLLDDDQSLDAYPRVFSLGKDRGAIAIWSTVNEKFRDTKNINERQCALDLHGRFVDKDGSPVGDIIEITKTTDDVTAVSANSVSADSLPDFSDFASDVAACVSYNDDGLIVYYSKREYNTDKKEVGDVFFPEYSVMAARRYTFGASKWYNGTWRSSDPEVDAVYAKQAYGSYGLTDAQAEERAKSYNDCFYGQLMYDCLPEVIVNEELDEQGFWKTTPSVSANGTGENPSLITDWDSISYNDLGLFAYTLDRDGNMKTYNDRDVYLQIFDFKDGQFVHPICVTTASESSEDSNVKFARAKTETMLTWLSDGDIKMLDVSRLLKGYSADSGSSLLLKGSSNDNDFYYINKEKKEGADNGYLPPYVVVTGEKTEDTEEDKNQGQKQEIGASKISSFDVVSNDDYIYFMWSQSGLKEIMSAENDEDGDYGVKDTLTEDQLYVARFDSSTGETSLPVQVTSEDGAHYTDPAMIINDEGGLTGLAYKAPTKKISAEEFNKSIEAGNKISDWDERQQKVDENSYEEFNVIDTENACPVAFKVLPEGSVKIKDAQLIDAAAGSQTGFAFDILNDSVKSRENLKVYVKDRDGNNLLESVSINAADITDDSKITGGDIDVPTHDVVNPSDEIGGEKTTEILMDSFDSESAVVEYAQTGYMLGGAKAGFGGTFIPDKDAKTAEITISVYDGDKLLVEETVSEALSEDCEVRDLEVTNTGVRNEYKVSGKLFNSGNALSRAHDISVGIAAESGDRALATVTVPELYPGEEKEFETIFTVNDSDFTAATDDIGNLKESFVAYASVKGSDSRTEKTAERVAYVDQMANINALTGVTLGTNNVVELTVSQCAAIAPSYTSTLASKEAESDGAFGLKFIFDEQSNDVFDITKDGVVNAFKPGSGEVTLHVYPSDREFEGENTSESLTGALGQNVDGYATMPAGAIFTQKYTIVVSEAGQSATFTDKKGVGYALVSGNNVRITGLSEAAASAKKVSIPATVKINGVKYNVTEIAPDAFRGNTTLQKVVIGKNVVTVGSGAFAACTALKTVRFGKNVLYIGNEAFMGDTALKAIKLPKRLVSIGTSAFEGCTLVKKLTIPAYVQNIYFRAFAGCSALKSVSVKTPVITRIGAEAFANIDSAATFKIGTKKDFREAVAAKFDASTGVTETMQIKK